MEILFRYVLPNFILVSTMIYIWNDLLGRKIDIKNSRLYISVILIMITTLLNYVLVNNFIRMVVLIVIFIIFFKFLFKEKLQISIVTPVFYQIIIMVSEFIYAILLVLFKVDINLTITSIFISMISNISIAIISILISKLKIVKKLYKIIIKITDKINEFQLLMFCLIAIFIENILLMSTYYEVEFGYLLFFNIVTTIICLLIIVYSLRTKNRFNKVYNKYNIVTKRLNDYENMMTKYRIANHENKNLLNTVRVMILNKEKDIPKYIESMIEEKYLDDEKLLFEMSVIPSGGLRATIYSEILKIKENNINYSLNIDKKLRTIDLIELDTNTILDVCKIIGVFIDNAIDEVKGLKNRNIGINLYLEEEKINIKVSNNYKNKIDIEKINDIGYTTKGEGHGYGLALVRDIIKSNSLLKYQTQIDNKFFGQIISIKYKKKK